MDPFLLSRMVFVAAAIQLAVGDAASPATLRGVVVDVYGGALPGATVSLQRSGDEVVRTTETDDTGRYSFSDLANGDYEMTAALNGFATTRARQRIFEDDDVLFDLTLDIAIKHGVPVTRLRGVVQDASGQPLAEARVVALLPASNRPLRIVESDVQGQFVLPLEGGQYLVYSYKPCYVAQARVLYLPPEGDETLTFELAPLDDQGFPCLRPPQ